MAASCSSSSSSCDSSSSFDVATTKICHTVKFLCSYGGRIHPRYPDGKLRYVGGVNRALTVDRSVPFSGLCAKLGELCGWDKVNLRCQLPTEDLDALVTIRSDEDLANFLEEYDLSNRKRRFPPKIHAILHPTAAKSPKSVIPPSISTPFMGHNADVARCAHQYCSPANKSLQLMNSCHDPRFHFNLANVCPAGAPHYLIHHSKYWQ